MGQISRAHMREIFGPEALGKTTIVRHLIADVQHAEGEEGMNR
jgi:RecA/RadA recombinase